MVKEIDSPLRHSVEVLLGLPEISVGINADDLPVSTGVFNPREAAEQPEIISQIESQAHWVDRLKVKKTPSLGSFEKLNTTREEGEWLSEVKEYASQFAHFRGLSTEQYVDLVIGIVGFPEREESMLALVDPAVPLSVLLPNQEEGWGGENFDKDCVDHVATPTEPYLLEFQLMKDPDHDLPKDDDGFVMYPPGRKPNPYLSLDYANDHIPEEMRGLTLKELAFLYVNGFGIPFRTTFALESTLDGKIPIIKGDSHGNPTLGIAQGSDVPDREFVFPLAVVA